jgi:hypothetical protein
LARGHEDFSFSAYVKTLAADNLVIDKLTQGAVTERRSVLENHSGVPQMQAGLSSVLRGKLFPRGARGFIRSVELYCDNMGSAARTFTVRLYPFPGSGRFLGFTLNVPGGAEAGWRSVAVGRMWNCDAVFVTVQCDDDTYGRLGYDENEPYDAWSSSDEVAWSCEDRRYWIRLVYAGMTVGDVPVSGTVNVIQLPNTAAYASSGTQMVSPPYSTVMLTVYGMGVLHHAVLVSLPGTKSHLDTYEIYADDVLAYSEFHYGLSLDGVGASTPGISLTLYVENGRCAQVVSFPIPFRRKLEVRCRPDPTAAMHQVYARIYYSLVR